MIVEYAQLMSTAHRMLDGKVYNGLSKNGRKIKRYKLPDHREEYMYKACHYNHPSAVWTRQSNNNYNWLYALWLELCKEYTHRYGKEHATYTLLKDWLCFPPDNIPVGYKTQPPPAMAQFPECIVEGDSVKSYRNYYIVAKAHFNKWTKRDVPNWYEEALA
jgi:hypothetical protein